MKDRVRDVLQEAQDNLMKQRAAGATDDGALHYAPAESQAQPVAGHSSDGVRPE